MNFLLCIPAIISGKTTSECINVYINQSKTYNSYISMLFPGVYNLFMKIEESDYIINSIDGLGLAFIIITFVILLIAMIIIIYKKVDIENKMIINLSLWSILLCAFLLPNMHERYIFMGDILSVLYFIINRDWKKIYIPIGVSLVSLYGYIRFLFGVQILNIKVMSLLNLLLLIIITKDCFSKMVSVKEKDR